MADIVETATQAGSFKTLASALAAADLINTLKESGPYTVFAPTDQAFSQLPAETLQDLLRPENKETLSQILLYHVVKGSALRSNQIQPGSTVQPVIGGQLALDAQGASVTVNDANVVQADVSADNGVIHVIDKVLLPTPMV